MPGPISTEEIDRANAADDQTLARLTAELRELEIQQRAAVATQSALIASGQGGDLGEVKRRIRDRASDIEAQAAATESVKQRISERAPLRRAAALQEARNREASALDRFNATAAALREKILASKEEIFALAGEHRNATNAANSAFYTAEQMAGNQHAVPNRFFTSNATDELLRALSQFS